ncbi:hypothetical protein [Paracoccus sp. FO-3]|uniref:hypothetical protein n=1 Tax=Paracoccus sp. FO-3 TaxID=1335059 RepID=UPI00112DC8F5|nr:hypothetical protein [Paracoccus sp. FO-3]
MRNRNPYDKGGALGPEDDDVGPYDAAQAEEDLWFLPGPDSDEPADPFAPPLPRAPRKPLFERADWRAAEAALAQPLAALALDLGRLIERAESFGPQAGIRLALAEAAALGWWSGDRISSDRIALWSALRIGATGEDGAALIRTAWAARRLAAPPVPGQGRAAAIAAHLGLKSDDPSGLVEDFSSLLPEPGALGPVVRGCLAFHLWRALDERVPPQRDIEAAVLGARLAIGHESAALGFLPLALAGTGALRAGGPAEQRLSAWIFGAHDAVLSALMMLDRLRRWRVQAEAGTADLSGRTPRLLIDGLLRHSMAAVPQLVAETGASRPALLRNLAILEQRGLAREVTGQGRYRVWAARF